MTDTRLEDLRVRCQNGHVMCAASTAASVADLVSALREKGVLVIERDENGEIAAILVEHDDHGERLNRPTLLIGDRLVYGEADVNGVRFPLDALAASQSDPIEESK